MTGVHLVRPVVKATPLVGFGPATMIALALALIASAQPAQAEFRMTPIRTGVLALAIAACFLFDDPAAVITDPAPGPLRTRRMVRVTTGLVATAIALTLVLVIGSKNMDLTWQLPDPQDPSVVDGTIDVTTIFPGGRIVLEATAIAIFGLAVAAVIGHMGHDQPGKPATSILLGVYLITWMLPDRWQPWATPYEENWDRAATSLWVTVVISTTVVAVFSWEARQRVISRTIRRPRRTHA